MYGVDPPLTMKRVRSQNSQKNPRNKVVVRVPATSANMGPGFDALGLGLDIWNEISVERAAKFKITTEGEGAGAGKDGRGISEPIAASIRGKRVGLGAERK